MKKTARRWKISSEKLEVEGRSCGAGRTSTFYALTAAAVASLIVLVLIALFVILAPMLQFAYDDTRTGR